jgi:N-acetylglucosaminyldiphosphoundecaprenol N-acetyl-beta-D-mannosaminyltransferase
VIPRPELFGVPVDVLSMNETVERCLELIAEKRPLQHVVLNAAKVVLMADDDRLREIVAGCGYVGIDGQSVVWAGRLLGIDVPERVAGVDLMLRMLAESCGRGLPVYFVGAEAGVLERFVSVVRERYPGLDIRGYRDGYFDNDAAVADVIASSGARVLFVGIPSPRKEYFISGTLDRMGPVFAMGVGGSFDVVAGVTRRAPVWMQRAGLEWSYRLLREPRRMWRRYLIGNVRFVILTIREYRTSRRRVSSRGDSGTG